MQILLTRVTTGFAPGDKIAWEQMQKFAVGKDVLCDIKQVRSPDQLRLYWALITKAWENQESYATKEDLSAAALCSIGHCYTVKRGDVVIERAKSIAFGNLEQDQFNEIFNAVAELLARTLGVTPDSLRGEAAETESERLLRGI